MIITLSGKPGSGKTTVAKILTEKLGYKFYSTGDLRGKMAMERGLTIDQLNELGAKEDWTDKEVDNYTAELAKKEDNIIFDSWLAFYFIPKSFKVFLDIDLKEAAKRVFKDQRPDEEHFDSPDGIEKMFRERLEQSRQRYLKYYNVDFLDKSHYDLIVDTTNLSPAEKVVDKILINLKDYERRKQNSKY